LDTHIFPETAQIEFFRKDPVLEYSGGQRSANKRIKKFRRDAGNVF